MSRDPERCPTTGALVDACRHCADDLPIDTPELDDHEETAVPAPPPPAPSGQLEHPLEVVATLTWTVHLTADAEQIDRIADVRGISRTEVLAVVAAEQGVRRSSWSSVLSPTVRIGAVALVDTDVQAVP